MYSPQVKRNSKVTPAKVDKRECRASIERKNVSGSSNLRKWSRASLERKKAIATTAGNQPIDQTKRRS